MENICGKISIVGIGPGNISELTPKARALIDAAEVIVGYKTYIELIGEIIGGKKILASGMRQEIQRAQIAIDEAQKNLNVAVISSGDAGVYGMAGLILEMILNLPENLQPKFEIAAGVSALNSAAAILGAPLMHDFAVISLSDWLTSLEVIKKRVALAAEGDFVIALFNPKSKSRATYIDDVQKILLEYRAENTPVGIVTNAGRIAEKKIISTLKNFTSEEINMFTLVLIGNSKTFVKSNFMITPRGYKI
ncbi:MAG: precorrin-3B C(17)-methyltransferase [Selenomonadaceae bacterium]|nr:precorrin-3B C(17)-methyltransferase [Selenomonadaceae bacterium]MBQ7629253.1 precorrin-3B C(17)-methyltransferase [Selenomonadaceae bacterium]